MDDAKSIADSEVSFPQKRPNDAVVPVTVIPASKIDANVLHVEVPSRDPMDPVTLRKRSIFESFSTTPTDNVSSSLGVAPPTTPLRSCPPFSPATPGQMESGKASFWLYLKQEVTLTEHTTTAQDIKRERVINFIHVPQNFEPLMIFGFLVCLDAWLAVFVVLPLRLLVAFFLSVWTLIKFIFSRNFSRKDIDLVESYKSDLKKFLVTAATCIVLEMIDGSALYHSIRGQSTIKLYVIFNVLEVCDRLCVSFGQDVLDSFLSRESNVISSAANRKISNVLSPWLHWTVAISYVVIHALVLFYQAITLNVAINSQNNALLTLLVSNQFVEIKSAVFKKFDREHVFQLACSDLVERFQLAVHISIIGLRNLLELTSGMPLNFEAILATLNRYGTTYFAPLLVLYSSEVIVDWLKHAFVDKFNSIPANIYGRFMDVLAKDVAGMGSDGPWMSDRIAQVARRVGFAPLPLACVVVRVFTQSWRMVERPFDYWTLICIILVYFCAFALKILVSLHLFLFSSERIFALEKRNQNASLKEETSNLEALDRRIP